MDESKSTPQFNLLIPGSIVLSGVIIALAVIYAGGGGTGRPATTPPQTPASQSGIAGGDLSDDDPSLGDPSAPVTIVEFSDFQCPFCRSLYLETLPQLKEKYIKTGKARLVYRDFPLPLHEMAETYARAGECADEQGKFWAMHDKIFDEQAGRGQGTISGISALDIKRWAAGIGLDAGRFNECLDSGRYADEVAKDYSDGQSAGVTGTPTVFINGRRVVGAVPFSQFESVIEAALQE